MYDVTNDTVEPVPVTINGSRTQEVFANIVLACIAAGSVYSVYSSWKRRKQADKIHELEMSAAANYDLQTGLQARTAEVENLAAREKAAAELGKSLEELQAMLRGDTEAIVRNLPETEEATA